MRPKNFFINYRNDLILGLVETYFLEAVIAGEWEGRFSWIWLETSYFFKYKNGGEWPKNFIV